MKGLVALGVLFVVGCVLSLVVVKKMNSDQGEMIAYAVGNPDGETQELHVVIYGKMIMRDPPKKDFNSGFEHWDEWFEKHLQVKDGSGNAVTFNRRASSELIKKPGGTPDSYAVGKVKNGATYTFDYIPEKDRPERYTHTITVTPDGIPLTRSTFELAK